LFQRSGAEVHAVRRIVGPGPIMVHLAPAGHAYAAVVLIEPQESSLVYAGPSRAELPESFEWTGTARRATLLTVFADEPLDGETLRRDGAKAAPKSAEVVQVPLERGQCRAPCRSRCSPQPVRRAPTCTAS